MFEVQQSVQAQDELGQTLAITQAQARVAYQMRLLRRILPGKSTFTATKNTRIQNPQSKGLKSLRAFNYYLKDPLEIENVLKYRLSFLFPFFILGRIQIKQNCFLYLKISRLLFKGYLPD